MFCAKLYVIKYIGIPRVMEMSLKAHFSLTVAQMWVCFFPHHRGSRAHPLLKIKCLKLLKGIFTLVPTLSVRIWIHHRDTQRHPSCTLSRLYYLFLMRAPQEMPTRGTINRVPWHWQCETLQTLTRTLEQSGHSRSGLACAGAGSHCLSFFLLIRLLFTELWQALGLFMSVDISSCSSLLHLSL